MLWMKAWLETRWRLLYVVVLTLAGLAFRSAVVRSTEDARGMMAWLSFFSVFAAVYLAGAGVRTQPGFQMTKGLHGSTYFTLSLPVSRFRLVAVRAGCGLLEISGINAIVIGSAWSLVPLVRANSTLWNLFQSILAAIVCTACIYFVSVLLASFLEETWHIFGGFFVVGLAWWGFNRLRLPASASVFRFMGDASPLVTHVLPWTAMGISLILSAVLFLAALKIVQAREY